MKNPTNATIIHSVYELCMVAPTCFGNTLPSSGGVPSAFWEMFNWGAVDRILWMGVLRLVAWWVAHPQYPGQSYQTLHFVTQRSYVIPTTADVAMHSWWWAWWMPETGRVLEMKAKIIHFHLVGYIYTHCNQILFHRGWSGEQFLAER
jgi:hypothetical protein